MFIIEEELKKLPAKPGVYIMHGEKDEIIYVGKAISLKNRVRQYFQSSRNKGAKIERMVTHITRFEYIITDSELEALVLECNLIKEHRPKYNTMLKDDKSYPFIKVTVHEPYPRVLFARRMKKDKARYFGPYTSGGAVKDVIELVRKLYQVRSCNRSLPRDTGKDRPCLYYHMKQCKAPCQGYVSQEEYRKNINKVIKFLNGDFQDAISELMEKMQKASEEMRYEDAMEYRDLISSIRKIGERQKITGYGQEEVRDCFNYFDRAEHFSRFQCFAFSRNIDKYDVAQQLLRVFCNAHGNGAIGFGAQPFVAGYVFQLGGDIAHGVFSSVGVNIN